jgi:hypothetical protein
MSRYVQYELNYEQMLSLEDKMSRYPGDVEKAVNNVIHNRGAKLIMMNIIGFMPRSKLNKAHAKDSAKNLESNTYNLGVMISEGKDFGYLVFPELGIGKRNPVEQAFMIGGLEKSSDVIFQWIVEALEYTPIF